MHRIASSSGGVELLIFLYLHQYSGSGNALGFGEETVVEINKGNMSSLCHKAYGPLESGVQSNLS